MPRSRRSEATSAPRQMAVGPVGFTPGGSAAGSGWTEAAGLGKEGWGWAQAVRGGGPSVQRHERGTVANWGRGPSGPRRAPGSRGRAPGSRGLWKPAASCRLPRLPSRPGLPPPAGVSAVRPGWARTAWGAGAAWVAGAPSVDGAAPVDAPPGLMRRPIDAPPSVDAPPRSAAQLGSAARATFAGADLDPADEAGTAFGA
jgi:hypothetical protein